MGSAVCLLVGALALVAIALAVQLARSERELRSIARFLAERDPDSNARVTVGMRTRGFVLLGQAVNRLIDRHQGERIAAEESKRALRRGLTCLSHDIRTPLAGAQGYVQLLADEKDERERARYQDVVARRLDDVEALLDQLYDYARTQDPDHRVEWEPVEVDEVLTESLASLYPQFKERAWEPDIELGEEALSVVSNADALKRIFRNLAVNALRHGSAPPRIARTGREVSFSNRVADPGAIDVDRLFERFYQGDRARSADGSGLGLAIVAELARALRIGLRARLDGDTLVVTLDFPA